MCSDSCKLLALTTHNFLNEKWEHYQPTQHKLTGLKDDKKISEYKHVTISLIFLSITSWTAKSLGLPPCMESLKSLAAFNSPRGRLRGGFLMGTERALKNEVQSCKESRWQDCDTEQTQTSNIINVSYIARVATHWNYLLGSIHNRTCKHNCTLPFKRKLQRQATINRNRSGEVLFLIIVPDLRLDGNGGLLAF